MFRRSESHHGKFPSSGLDLRESRFVDSAARFRLNWFRANGADAAAQDRV